MKINLSVGKPDISGYNNINLLKQQVDLNNVNNICEAAECTELILDEFLQYIPVQQVAPFLKSIITRLRKNGKIMISGFDVNETIKQYLNGIISLADLNNAVFGAGDIKKRSCCSYNDILNILTTEGLKILSVGLNAGIFNIVAQRNS